MGVICNFRTYAYLIEVSFANQSGARWRLPAPEPA